ncbi:MAG: histidine triad nucleotide-binding protein, partial [Patescibacteria group bacterium]
MEKTIFSKIIDREIPSTILYEDENYIVIKDINP